MDDELESQSSAARPEIPAIKNGALTRRDHMRFTNEIEHLVKDAEALRLSYMKRHQTRTNMALTLGLLSLVIGAGGFGWFLLVQADLLRALGAIALAIVIPVALNIWASQSLKSYGRVYKEKFLPRLAKALGDLEFHPRRGIGAKLLSKTGVLPAHALYESEDCFMGTYKGVKVIFSETRLLQKNKTCVFDGIFVLLELPHAPIQGHTIVTADLEMYKKNRSTRWAKLQDVEIKAGESQNDRFKILSSAPAAASLISETLLKELCEISDLYDRAHLNAVFFREKFIFMMIPYSRDMFEPSTVHIPVATRQHALHCKREIEQILEVIDVLELYQQQGTAKPV